jgi:pilus assembly protein Flp/PilA
MKLTLRQWLHRRLPTGSDDRGDQQRRRRTGVDRDQEHTMTNLVTRFANDESGATAIEYGLIAAGISVAIITVVNTLGSQLKSTFTSISTQLGTAGK